MPDAPVVGDALAATTRIQKRHVRDERYTLNDGTLFGPCECENAWPCPDRADAGVVAERLHEAITHLEAIYDEIGKTRSRWSVIQDHAVAALDCLRGSS